jgi:hypothetical protein
MRSFFTVLAVLARAGRVDRCPAGLAWGVGAKEP